MQEMKSVGKGNTAEVFEYGNERVCKLLYLEKTDVLENEITEYLKIIEFCRQYER